MINNLIKKCQEEDSFKSCEECGYYCNYDEGNNNFFCLEELIQRYNEKYNTSYRIADNNKIEKVKELLDEC